MQWIPRQSGMYILSNIYIWTGHIFLMIVSVFATIRGLNMFENIPEINNVIAMCAVAVIGWIGLIQYSKYVQHIKAHIDSSETKFKHAKEFAFRVTLNGAEIGTGTGRSKKEAEQSAACAALEHLKNEK